MSLELFAELKDEIPEHVIDEIIALIELYGEYEKLYSLTSGINGFSKKNTSKKNGEPPLFELIFNRNEIILSVYGSIREQREIKMKVELASMAKNVSLVFFEE